MSDYHPVGQFKEQNGKWRFNRLGSARQNDKGGWDIYLDALPMPDAKGCRLSIVEPRDTQDDYREKRATGPMAGDPYDGGDAVSF